MLPLGVALLGIDEYGDIGDSAGGLQGIGRSSVDLLGEERAIGMIRWELSHIMILSHLMSPIQNVPLSDI